MVVTLQGSERSTYPDYFNRLFQLRYQIFVAGRGWPLPSKNGCEIDQYDVDNAVYFLDVNDDDEIEGAVRITPTETDSLTADYFSHLVEIDEPLRAPDVYEATRYIVLPIQKSGLSNRRVSARILCALTEWCLEAGVSSIQAVIDKSTLAKFVELNPQVKPMGLPHPYGGGPDAPGGGECIAIRWPCSQKVIDDVREYGELESFAGAMASDAIDHGEAIILTH